jgi:D-alanyl-D-alanine dipeptidase
MSMVVFMEWAVKRQLLAGFSAIALVAYLVVFRSELIGVEQVIEKEPIVITSCFEDVTATIRVTTAAECPASFISLGNGALSQESESVTALHPILANRFEAARLVAQQSGINLYISSGFRDEARQAVLFEEALKKYGSETEAAKWVLPAASSHHPDGLAIDVNYPGNRPGATWLEKNGSRFGLCRVYANEWWHFEGVIAPGESCPPLAPNALVDLR